MSIPEEMLQQIQWRQLNNAGLLPVAGSTGGIGSLGGASTSTATGLSGLLGRGSGMLAGAEYPGAMAAARQVAPPLIASQLATGAINAALPSTGSAGNARQILGDAATGAGIGAAAGSFFPGVGTLTGGLVGGAAGGLYGALDSFFGSDSMPDDPKKQLAQAASQLGLDPTQYTTAYDLLAKSGADKKTLGTQLAQQLLQDGQTKRQTDAATALQSTQRAGDQQFALAMQAQAAQFFTPYVNNIITAGQSQAELLKGQASNLPAPYRDVLLNQAQQAIGESQRLAGAYAAQASMLPSQYMMSADLKRQQELAQLQYQQSVVNAQSGGGSGNFSQLAQQLAGQTG